MRQLEHFLAVSGCGSLGKAARQLGLTQSGLTKSVQALEEILGIQLLIRNVRGVELTTYGQNLTTHVKLLLAQADNAFNDLESLEKGETGNLRIGISPIWLMENRLPEIISDMVSLRPKLNLQILSRVSSRTLFETLQTGDLDIVVGTEQIGDHPEIGFIFLMDDVHGVIARKNHPILKNKSPKLSDLDRYGWILREEGALYRVKLESLYFAEDRQFPQPVMETNSIPLILSTVAKTDFISSARQADYEHIKPKKIAMLNLPYRWHRRVGIMYRRNEPLSDAGSHFIETMKSEFLNNKKRRS